MQSMKRRFGLAFKLIIKQILIFDAFAGWASVHRHLLEFWAADAVSPHISWVTTTHTEFIALELLLHRRCPFMQTEPLKLMTMLPLTRKCVHWIITVFIFIILDVIILIINLNSIILSDERSIWTTFGDAFVNYSLVLAAVGLIYYRLNIMPPQTLSRLIIRMNQFVQYFKVIIFHMVRLNLLSGSQNCISHL